MAAYYPQGHPPPGFPPGATFAPGFHPVAYPPPQAPAPDTQQSSKGCCGSCVSCITGAVSCLCLPVIAVLCGREIRTIEEMSDPEYRGVTTY